MTSHDDAGAPRYPGYDVLAKAEEWDARTQETIRRRVEEVPSRRFFSEAEWNTLEALFDVVIPQDDREPRLRIPIVPWLDERLHRRESRGYRHEDMPPDPKAWWEIVRALDDEAQQGWQSDFAQLHSQERERLLQQLQRGDAKSPRWTRVPRAFSLILEEAARHYYAHPTAWNEIGFAGPKFPRIYPRVDRDNPDEPQEATTRA